MSPNLGVSQPGRLLNPHAKTKQPNTQPPRKPHQPQTTTDKLNLDKYQNKYRIASARAPFWDYAWNAAYFVTICTKNRKYWFGDVVDGKMELSEIGRIADTLWREIPGHFPFVALGPHVVMPNHVHGIVIINKPHDGYHNPVASVETPKLGVSTTATGTPTTTDSNNRTHAASQKWKPGTLGVIINQYKRAVTIGARKIDTGFAWQSRYHDRIIRDESSYHIISAYILNNPLKWSEDKFYHR